MSRNVSVSERSTDIMNAVENAIDSRHEDHDRIEQRECSSDRFKGVELKIYGQSVSIRPIIDTIAEREDEAIEQMIFVDEADDTHLNVFVAYIPEQEHPAFV